MELPAGSAAMDKEEASETVRQMLAKHIFGSKAIEAHLASKGIRSKSDMTRIMLAMVEQRAQVVNFVKDHFVDCALQTDEFLRLVVGIHKWHPQDLWPLSQLYPRDPQTSSWLIQRLEAMSQDASPSLSYLYVGMGEKEPERLLRMMDERMSPTQETAWMTAVDILYAKQKIPPGVDDFVIRLSRSSTTAVQQCAISVMLGRTQESKRIRDQLCRIAENGSEEARAAVANIHPTKRLDDEFRLKILGLCSNTENVQIRDSIAWSLVPCAPEYPLECMKIVRRWSEHTSSCYEFGHLLEAVRKGDLDRIRRFMESWIREAKNPKTGIWALPCILSHVYWEDEMQLVNLLETAGCKDKTTQILALAVLKTFLSKGYENVRRSDEFFEYAEKIVLGISKQLGINARPNPELGIFMRLLDLIEQIEYPKKKDIANARNNLKRLKHLDRIVGKGKLEKMIRDEHPLAVRLSTALPEPDPESRQGNGGHPKEKPRRTYQQARAYTMLSKIDSALELFGNSEGTSRMRKGLVSKTEFFDTVAELMVATRLNKFPVTLQPRVGNHRLDVESTICGSRIFFEVFRPKQDLKLRYVEKAHSVNNAIRDKIVKKIDGQIGDAADTGCPVVLVIDGSDAWEITDSDIVDSLSGTEFWTQAFYEDGAVGPLKHHRAQDSIHKASNARVISAVLFVNIDYDRSEMNISGRLFRASDAAVPLDDRKADAIKKAILHAD